MKFRPGDMLPATVMEAVTGGAINLPDAKRLVHLQFRRFVDCPICNTHIAEFRKRAREIEAAGIKEADRVSFLIH
jgi:peroxiredoxin